MGKLIALQFGKYPLDGHINIDSRPWLFPEETNGICIPGQYSDFDCLFDNGTIDKIVFGEPLQSLSPEETTKCVKYWAEKLNNGGKLVLYYIGTGIFDDIVHRKVSKSKINEYFFGTDGNFKSVMNRVMLSNLAAYCGLTEELYNPQTNTLRLRKK